MTRSTSARLCVVLVVLVGSTGLAATVGAADEPVAAISAVSVTPSDPAPGEKATVETTVSNLGSGSVEITDVFMKKNGKKVDEALADNPRTVSANQSVTIPMSVLFKGPGEKRLTVYVEVKDENWEYHTYERLVYVTVERADEVQLSFSAEDAVAGAETTVNATVANSYNATINNVRLTLDGTGTVETPRRVAASIEPGAERSFRYPVTFDESGSHTITGEVTYATAEGVTRTTTDEVRIDVEEPEELPVSFSTTDAVAGVDTPVNVTVSNSYAGSITNVQVGLGGEGASVENAERVRAAIASGADHPFEYDVEFDATGARSLDVVVTYTTSDGVTRTRNASVVVDVDEPTVEANLSATTNGSGTTVELTNFGNTVLSDVELSATVDGDVVGRTLMADVGPESSRSVAFDVDDSASGTVTFTATYESVGDSYTADTTADVRAEVPGAIRLTGVEIRQVGPSLQLDGDASNVGSTDAESVLVRVGERDGVTPVAPSGEYFVGTVEASEFATFELTARTRPDVSSIPVRISYIVDGERVTTTQQVDVESASASMPGGGPGGPAGAGGDGAPGGPDGPPGSGGPLGGLPVVPVVLALVVVAVAVFAVRRWRNQ